MSDTEYAELIAELDAGCNDGGDLPGLLNRAALAIAALATTGGETEWEYGCISSSHTPLNAEARRFDWIEDARSHEFECASPAIVRRRKAGPWVAVDPTSPETTETEGTSAAHAALSKSQPVEPIGYMRSTVIGYKTVCGACRVAFTRSTPGDAVEALRIHVHDGHPGMTPIYQRVPFRPVDPTKEDK